MNAPFLASSTVQAAVVVVAVGIALLVIVAVSTANSFRRRKEWGGRRSLDELLARWWVRRLTGIAVGLFVGVAVASSYVWWVGADRARSAVDLIVVGALVGCIVGRSLMGFPIIRVPESGVRVAESRRHRLVDSTPTWLHVVSMVAVAAAVLLSLVTIAVSTSSPRFAGFSPVLDPPVILTVIAVLSYVGFEVVGRVLIRQRTSAGSGDELRSQMIFRRFLVGDLVETAAITGVLATLLSLPGLLIAFGVRAGVTSAPVLAIVVMSIGISAVALSVVAPLLRHTFSREISASPVGAGAQS